MPFDRPAALTYSRGLYKAMTSFLVENMEFIADDVAQGYKPALDEAGLIYGLDWDNLEPFSIASADVRTFQAILRYTTLKTFEAHLLTDEVVNVEGLSQKVESKASNILASVRSAIIRAEGELATLGVIVEAADVARVGTLRADVYEPFTVVI
jgi:hypothetical protein